MPEKYTVKITQQAQEQIREIISYIRFTLQAPETAMPKGCHRNDISTLTVHIITQIPQFGTRCNKVIQQYIIDTSVHMTLKSHSLTDA